MWTFLELDTRNGRIWQVQYSVKGNQLKTALSLDELATGEDQIRDRFSLHPTQNDWNFVLIDQYDGRTWQVQWNIEENKRMIIPIY